MTAPDRSPPRLRRSRTAADAVARPKLSDDLAQRVRQLVEVGGYGPGDRLPSIAAMAERFGVARPTLREALGKLETLGFVRVHHGSGVYVARAGDPLFIRNPVLAGGVSRSLRLDALDARIPIELRAVAEAASRRTEPQLERLQRLLDSASETLDDEAALGAADRAFHGEIALASGNAVLHQLVEGLAGVTQEELQSVLATSGSRRQVHAEHVAILEALERQEPELAAERMRSHLEAARAVLERRSTPQSSR